MEDILSEIKKGEVTKVEFNNAQLHKFFPYNYSPAMMKREILEILKSIQLDIKGLKDEVKDLKEGQKIIEKKLDGVVEQTAELLEFRTTVKTKLDELKEVEEVTKVNCYDIAKLKAVK